MLKRSLGKQEDLEKCPVCEVYFIRHEGFICVKCRRGPLCKKHRVAGTKECTSCAMERMQKVLSELKEQERNIEGFLRLLQFIFLMFAVLFIASKIGLEDTVEFLQYSIVKEGLIYLGIGAFLGYLVFYFILNNQKAKTLELETVIKKKRLINK